MIRHHLWRVADRMACCFPLLNACLHVLPAAAQLLCPAGCGVQQQHEPLMASLLPPRTASQAAVLPFISCCSAQRCACRSGCL